MSIELKKRTQRFTLDCWYLCRKLPKSREFDAYVRQLIRSSSSVGANYRAALRGKSDRDFINKLKIVEEEVDESAYCLELFQEVYSENKEQAFILHKEGKEILAIIVASIKTAKQNNKR